MTPPDSANPTVSDAQTFPRSSRLVSGADFTRSFAEGRRFSSRYFRILWCSTETPARLGMAVSRKVSTRAVDRNRIKRCVRESFRRVSRSLPPGDVVLVAFRDAAAASVQQLNDELARAWTRIATLPQSQDKGTIRRASAGQQRPRDPVSPETPSLTTAERLPLVDSTLPSA